MVFLLGCRTMKQLPSLTEPWDLRGSVEHFNLRIHLSWIFAIPSNKWLEGFFSNRNPPTWMVAVYMVNDGYMLHAGRYYTSPMDGIYGLVGIQPKLEPINPRSSEDLTPRGRNCKNWEILEANLGIGWTEETALNVESFIGKALSIFGFWGLNPERTHILTLPETNSLHLKIGRIPKGMDFVSPHFQNLC